MSKDMMWFTGLLGGPVAIGEVIFAADYSRLQSTHGHPVVAVLSGVCAVCATAATLTGSLYLGRISREPVLDPSVPSKENGPEVESLSR